MASMMGAPGAARLIDSHLHVWSDDVARWPREQAPPARLDEGGFASHERFVERMDAAGVSGAVIVQPINYGFQHDYVNAAIAAHPARLRGILLADPTAGEPAAAIAALERVLAAAPRGAWVGARFNPYLWPASAAGGGGGVAATMADATGRALFARCGELGLAVGFMAFKGLARHAAEIEALMRESPKTLTIIDHWGFPVQPATGEGAAGGCADDGASLGTLLRLGREYPQCHVKLSALFRVSLDAYPHASLDAMFASVVEAFGARRCMWGSDFPFVMDHLPAAATTPAGAGSCAAEEAAAVEPYAAAPLALTSLPSFTALSTADQAAILGGTAARLFGFRVA